MAGLGGGTKGSSRLDVSVGRLSTGYGEGNAPKNASDRSWRGKAGLFFRAVLPEKRGQYFF